MKRYLGLSLGIATAAIWLGPGIYRLATVHRSTAGTIAYAVASAFISLLWLRIAVQRWNDNKPREK